MRALILLLWTIQACDPSTAPPGDAPDERDVVPERAGTWRLGEGTLRLSPEGRLILEGAEGDQLLDEEIVGLPAIAGPRVVWARRQGQGTALVAREPGSPSRVLVDRGTPDRPALSPDGQRVVFVWNASGLASLWEISFQGGDPVQITNQDLEFAPRQPGQPPAGYLPPPHDGPPVIDADGLVSWEAPDGTHTLRLP